MGRRIHDDEEVIPYTGGEYVVQTFRSAVSLNT